MYRPYRPKRKTRASVAKEKGLEPLAAYILEQNASESIEKEAEKYVDSEKGVSDVKEALQGAKDIIAEQISDNADYRSYIREATVEEGKLVAKKAVEAGIKAVVFDRGGYVYHGRVLELAEGAREGGLEF